MGNRMIIITAFGATVRVNTQHILYYYYSRDEGRTVIVLSNGYTIYTENSVEAIDKRIEERTDDQPT